MDSFNIDTLVKAVNGFVSSVGQTSNDVGNQISRWGDSVSSQLPPTIAKIFPHQKAAPPKVSALESLCNWLYDHISLVLLGSVTSAVSVYYLRQRQLQSRRNRGGRFKSQSKRRIARRAENGGRREVVLLVGSPHEPLVLMIAQDLNVRGFIVYVTATPMEEDALAKEKSEDIRALRLTSYFDPEAVQSSLSHFSQHLKEPVVSFSGADPHLLSLTGIVIVPDLFYPTGPLEMTSASQWAQTVQSKIQMPLNFLAIGGLELARSQSSRFVLITPAITGALSPAFHSAESVVYAALSSLALALSRELSSQNIHFTHLRLGSFDTRPIKFCPPSPNSKSKLSSNSRVTIQVQADLLSWPEDMKRIYGGRYKASSSSLGSQAGGSNIRELYHSIYDILMAPRPRRVVRVGRGSLVYDWLTSWAPESILTLLLAANENK